MVEDCDPKEDSACPQTAGNTSHIRAVHDALVPIPRKPTFFIISQLLKAQYCICRVGSEQGGSGQY
jgi:hypothetical protein